MWLKERGTESDSSLSSPLNPVRRRKEREGKMPQISGGGTEALTRTEGSARAINAELDVWNLTLELTLKRAEVPELKEEENPEMVSSR